MSPARKRRHRASIETAGYTLVVALLLTYVVFITGRIASTADATGVLLTIGGSLLLGALAAAAGAAWGRHDSRRVAPAPRPERAAGDRDPRRRAGRPGGRVVPADG